MPSLQDVGLRVNLRSQSGEPGPVPLDRNSTGDFRYFGLNSCHQDLATARPSYASAPVVLLASLCVGLTSNSGRSRSEEVWHARSLGRVHAPAVIGPEAQARKCSDRIGSRRPPSFPS